MRPVLLRPPVFDSGLSSDFSGVERVISTKSATDEPRRPGVVGLYLRIPMWFQSFSSISGARTEDVDRALAEGDDRTLGVLALAEAESGATGLALTVQGVDLVDLDVEDLLDGDLDLRLVRTGVDDEGVLALVEQPVGLLGDDRCDQDVAGVLGVDAHLVASLSALSAFTGPATNASRAAWVKTMSSAHRTSYVLSWSATRTWTFCRLRTDLNDTSSPRSSTTSRLGRSVRPASSAAASFAEGSSPETMESTTWMRSKRARSERAPRRAAAFIFLGVRCE